MCVLVVKETAYFFLAAFSSNPVKLSNYYTIIVFMLCKFIRYCETIILAHMESLLIYRYTRPRQTKYNEKRRGVPQTTSQYNHFTFYKFLLKF